MSNCGLHVSVLVPAFDSLTLLLIAGPRVVPVFNYFEELQAILSFYVLNTEAGSPLPSPSALVFSVLNFVCLFFVVKKSDHPYEWEVTPHCSFGVISWGLWDTTHLSGSNCSSCMEVCCNLFFPSSCESKIKILVFSLSSKDLHPLSHLKGPLF